MTTVSFGNVGSSANLGKVRKKYNAPAVPEQQPRCPKHNAPMAYDSTEDAFACKTVGCEQKAYRRITFVESFGDSKRGIPIYRGPIEVTEDEKGNRYLFLTDANVAVDVTQIFVD